MTVWCCRGGCGPCIDTHTPGTVKSAKRVLSSGSEQLGQRLWRLYWGAEVPLLLIRAEQLNTHCLTLPHLFELQLTHPQ